MKHGGVIYNPKDAEIIVTTLSSADTWTQVLTKAQGKSARGVKVKSRVQFNSSRQVTTNQNPFDIALSASPSDNFWSNSGSGIGDAVGYANGLWAKSPVANTVIEVFLFK